MEKILGKETMAKKVIAPFFSYFRKLYIVKKLCLCIIDHLFYSFFPFLFFIIFIHFFHLCLPFFSALIKVDIDVKACSLQKQTQFSRFSKKSFHTLAYMTQDKGMKKVINSRQIRAQRRWHTAIEMTKLRNLNVGKDASKAMQNVVTAFVARKQSRETIMEENETLLEEPQPNTSGIRKFLTQENKNPNKNTRLETLQGPILEQPEDINDSVRDHKWEPPNYEEINQYEDIVKESRSNNNTGEQSSEEENKGSPTEVSYIDQFKVAYANENEENILEEDKANPDVINTNNGVEDSDDTIIDESSRL